MRTVVIGATVAAMLASGAALAQSQQQGHAGMAEPAQQQAPGTMGQGMGPGMMGQGMGSGMMCRGMGPGMMGQGMCPGMMGQVGPGYGMAGKGMKPHMMLMMALVDTDESGSVSIEEIHAVHARMFKLADSDDDGELTMEEIHAFMHPGLDAPAD